MPVLARFFGKGRVRKKAEIYGTEAKVRQNDRIYRMKRQVVFNYDLNQEIRESWISQEGQFLNAEMLKC